MSPGRTRRVPEADGVSPVREMLRRHLGGRADQIELELTATDGPHRHTYEVRDGRLIVTGTDSIAVAAGIGRFAKTECGLSATWDNDRWLQLPAELVDVGPVSHTTELSVRYYLNFVTYGYTTAFWDWNRWEREIDWMALHGINTPLMALAHEAVLTATYRELGLDDERIASWIGSVAHFPWTWMGATNEWGGPVPRRWLDQHLDLARRVLARQRELGMTPILPGFAGHVPPELAQDGADELTWQGWKTPVLDPSSERFARTAEVFYRQQHDLLGTSHHYATDPYIESVPPSDEPAVLRRAAHGIFHAMSSADPDAVWVLQGWPFHYHKGFWTQERIRAFLEPVPVEQLMVLDLWAEHAPMWRDTDALWGRRWLWCMVHNFGGRPAVFGDLEGLHQSLTDVQKSPAHGELVGMGLTMEAIENNAVVYELATDLVWSPVVDLATWLHDFARQRYRTDAKEAVRAWELLAATVYGPGRTRSTPSPVLARPWTASAPFATQRLAGEFVDPTQPERQSANIDAENDPAVLGDLASIADAVKFLFDVTEDCPPEATAALHRDIADLVGHVVAQHSRLAIRDVLAASSRGDADEIAAAAHRLTVAISDLDSLAASRPESLVGRWIADARAWGSDDQEADVLERDARTLLTVWGRQTSGLHDYSGRHWSGLLRDYYLPRWMAWTDWLSEAARAGAEPREADLQRQIVQLEEGWRCSLNPYHKEPEGDTVSIARRILERLHPELEQLRYPSSGPNTRSMHTEKENKS
jgi:alpha-N-acetylglucosaminidase